MSEKELIKSVVTEIYDALESLDRYGAYVLDFKSDLDLWLDNNIMFCIGGVEGMSVMVVNRYCHYSIKTLWSITVGNYGIAVLDDDGILDFSLCLGDKVSGTNLVQCMIGERSCYKYEYSIHDGKDIITIQGDSIDVVTSYLKSQGYSNLFLQNGRIVASYNGKPVTWYLSVFDFKSLDEVDSDLYKEIKELNKGYSNGNS